MSSEWEDHVTVRFLKTLIRLFKTEVPCQESKRISSLYHIQIFLENTLISKVTTPITERGFVLSGITLLEGSRRIAKSMENFRVFNFVTVYNLKIFREPHSLVKDYLRKISIQEL